jgi:hypothetical protein
MKNRLLSIALLATLMLSMAAVFPIKAAVNDVEFYFVPSDSTYYTGTTSVGYKFNVTCMWKDVVPLVDVYAWQVRLVVDASMLQITRAWAPTWDADYLLKPRDPDWLHPAPVGLGTNDVTIMGSLQAPATNVSDLSAKLAIFELNITSAPGKYVNFTSLLNIDWPDDTLWGIGTTPMTWNHPLTTNGTFKYAWTAPASPYLAVSPSTDIVFGPLPPSAVGEEFNVQVYLKALDAAWNLHNGTFRLTYSCSTSPPAQIIEVATITPDLFWTTCTYDNTTTVGIIDVNFTKTPSVGSTGDFLIITVEFRVIFQGSYPAPDEIAPLVLSNIVLFDTLQTIPTLSAVNGRVVVKTLIVLPFPHLEVSNVTLGPDPVPTGTLFNVTVSIIGLNESWYFIGLDFRLDYDESLMTPIVCYEGPFLPYYASLEPGSLGTWWSDWFESDGLFGPHVLIGNLIFPNETGKWWYPFPQGNGVVATVTFRLDALQSYGEPDFTSSFDILEEDWVGIDNPVGAQNIVDIPYDPPVNGTFLLTTNWPGRMIDIYTQYPTPYGGQGLNMPSDMFWPQKQVELYANVTYNYWPVQEKDVAFEVRDPHGLLVTIQVARTDADGVAHTWYRIPWPCDVPESLFGVWTVTATVDLACIVINDTLQFHFDYMVEIFKVTTDRFQVNHLECFNVIIEYGSHAQQYYPLVIQAILYDNLSVPVAQGYYNLTQPRPLVGGTHFCEYKNNTIVITLCIPKYAFAGLAQVFVNAYDKLPTEGGSPLCPTFGLINPFGYAWPIGETVPIIAIQPK